MSVSNEYIIEFDSDIIKFLKFRNGTSENGTSIISKDKSKFPILKINQNICQNKTVCLIITLLNQDEENPQLHRYSLFGERCQNGAFIYNGLITFDQFKLQIKLDKKTKREGKLSTQKCLDNIRKHGIADYSYDHNQLDVERAILNSRIYFWENNAWNCKQSISVELFDEKFISSKALIIEALEYIREKRIFMLVINGCKKFLPQNEYYLEVKNSETDYQWLCNFLDSPTKNCKYFQVAFIRGEHKYIRVKSAHFESEDFELKDEHFDVNLDNIPFEVADLCFDYSNPINNNDEDESVPAKRSKGNNYQSSIFTEEMGAGNSILEASMKEPSVESIAYHADKNSFFTCQLEEAEMYVNEQLPTTQIQNENLNELCSEDTTGAFSDISIGDDEHYGLNEIEATSLDTNEGYEILCSVQDCNEQMILSCPLCRVNMCIDHIDHQCVGFHNGE